MSKLISRQASTVIGRSAHDIFSKLETFEADHLWRKGVVGMRITSEQRTGLGATHIEVREMVGRRIETPASVVAYEPDRLLAAQRSSGPVRPIATYTLEPVSGGTRLTLDLAIPLEGTWRVATPLVALMLRLVMSGADDDLARLKTLMESRAS